MSTRELIIADKLDTIAKAIHDNWRKSETDPTWDEILELLRDSNRQQADHMLVKVRSINANIVKIDKSNRKRFTFSNEEIETLSRMEHRRWNAELHLNGWKYGEKRDEENKTSPYLINFEELEDEIQEKDRESVRFIPDLLELLGFEIVRNIALPKLVSQKGEENL